VTGESEFWQRIIPLKTAYRRVVMAALALAQGDVFLARERLGAAQTAISWARDRGILDLQTARYLQGLIGSRIAALERGNHATTGALEYVADRILLVICRLYRRVMRGG